MKNKQELSFSFQAVKSGKGYAIIAYVQYGYQVYNSKHKYELDDTGEIIDKRKGGDFIYVPCVVSTGLWTLTKDYSQVILKSLDLFKTKVQELYKLFDKKPSPEILKNNIKEYIVIYFKEFTKDIKRGKNVVLPSIELPLFLGKNVGGVPSMVIPYIDYKIEQIKSEGYSIHNIKPSTLTVYNKFKNVLISYKNETGINFNIQKIVLDDLKQFILWCEKRGYKYNYLQSMKKEFRQILNKAKVDGVVTNINLDDKFFKNSWVKQQDPYFFVDELEKLKKFDFKKLNIKDQKKVKDQFDTNISCAVLDLSRDFLLIACACGARFSDLKNIHHIFQDEKGKYYFEYTSQKTGIKSKIPIFDSYIINLYKKYKGEFNLKIQEQTYNEAIKAVCMLVGLNRKILINNIDTHTGKKTVVVNELWEVVTSKIGRKTMCSLAVKIHQIPLSILASWSGHTSEVSLKNYIQLSDEEYYALGQRLAHQIGI